jgi:hypothetical protein
VNVKPSSDYFGKFEFTLIFTTNFVGFLDIRASREVFPIEVRSPETFAGSKATYQRLPAELGPGSFPGTFLISPSSANGR